MSMTVKLYRVAAVVFVVLMMTSCNSGVFISEIKLPDNSNIVLDGEGGYYPLIIPREGLKRIYLEKRAEDAEYIHYEGIDGMDADENTPVSQLEGIYFENPILDYSLGLSGDVLYIHTHYNCSGESKHVRVFLEYETATKTIDIEIEKGRDLQYLFNDHEDEIKVESDVKTEVSTLTYKNGSNTTQWVNLMPYKDSHAYVTVSVEEPWAVGLKVPITVPLAIGNNSQWGYVDLHTLITFGAVNDIEVMDRDYTVPVFIQPGQTVQIKCTVYYSSGTSCGEVLFVNPVYGRDVLTNTVVTTLYPVRYELAVERID